MTTIIVITLTTFLITLLLSAFIHDERSPQEKAQDDNEQIAYVKNQAKPTVD